MEDRQVESREMDIRQLPGGERSDGAEDGLGGRGGEESTGQRAAGGGGQGAGAGERGASRNMQREKVSQFGAEDGMGKSATAAATQGFEQHDAAMARRPKMLRVEGFAEEKAVRERIAQDDAGRMGVFEHGTPWRAGGDERVATAQEGLRCFAIAADELVHDLEGRDAGGRVGMIHQHRGNEPQLASAGGRGGPAGHEDAGNGRGLAEEAGDIRQIGGAMCGQEAGLEQGVEDVGHGGLGCLPR